MKTVLVCGGRGFLDDSYLGRWLDDFEASDGPISLVIHGGATGADSLAGEWARSSGIPCQVFKADWKTHGKAAGPIRNQRMLDEGQPDIVVAFSGGKGTANMVALAQASGIPVIKAGGST